MQVVNMLIDYFASIVVDGRFELGLSEKGVFVFMRYATDFEIELNKVCAKYGILDSDYTLVLVTQEESNWESIYCGYEDDFADYPDAQNTGAGRKNSAAQVGIEPVKVAYAELQDFIEAAMPVGKPFSKMRFEELYSRFSLIQEMQYPIYSESVSGISFDHTVAYRKLRLVCLRYVKSLDSLGFEVLTEDQITRILKDRPTSEKTLLDYGVPACCCKEVFEVLIGTPIESPKINGSLARQNVHLSPDYDSSNESMFSIWDILRIIWVVMSIPVCYLLCYLTGPLCISLFAVFNIWILFAFNALQSDVVMRVCSVGAVGVEAFLIASALFSTPIRFI